MNATESQQSMGVLAGFGYALAILFPVLGFFVGLIVGIRHRPPAKNHGPWIMFLSVVMFFVFVFLLLALSV